MRIRCKAFFLAALCLSLLSVSAAAAVLSPGLSLIAAQSTMTKTGNRYTGVVFSGDDFKNALSLRDLDGITVTSLPAPASGTLYLGDMPVAVNQRISAANLSRLRFEPTNGETQGAFTFSESEEYSVTCVMRIIDTVNYAPSVSAFADTTAARTMKDITCCGTLGAYDPEGDALRYEIVSQPKKGLITLTDAAHGDFRYTPYEGYSGTDTFSYRVCDANGNYSTAVPVNVEISHKNTRLVFADMTEHWAHSAAIEMADAGIMTYAEENGAPVFRPEETVKREEFLVMVMKVFGAKDLSGDAATGFSDNDEITPEYRGYVRAARRGGIVRGTEENGAFLFRPGEAITRAETAVMLNNIIGAEVPLQVSLFSDNDAIPAWAQSALYALNDIGILRGTGAGSASPYASITRAQAAQILSNLRAYVG